MKQSKAKPERCGHPDCNCMKQSKAKQYLMKILPKSVSMFSDEIDNALDMERKEAKREVFEDLDKWIDRDYKNDYDFFTGYDIEKKKHIEEEK